MDRYLESAKYYHLNLRSVSTDCKTVKNYTDKNSYSLTQEMSFDSENIKLTSIDYFTGAISSSIMFSILKYDHKHSQLIEEIECKFSFVLDNPLSYLSVKGCDGISRISKIKIDCYIVTFSEEEEILSLFEQAISHSIVYQTLLNSVEFTHKIKIIY